MSCTYFLKAQKANRDEVEILVLASTAEDARAKAEGIVEQMRPAPFVSFELVGVPVNETRTEPVSLASWDGVKENR